MEDKFKVNKRKELLIYLMSYLLLAIINVAFWINFPDMIQNPDAPEDVKFIYIGAFALVGGTVGTIIHSIMFFRSKK